MTESRKEAHMRGRGSDEVETASKSDGLLEHEQRTERKSGKKLHNEAFKVF